MQSRTSDFELSGMDFLQSGKREIDYSTHHSCEELKAVQFLVAAGLALNVLVEILLHNAVLKAWVFSP